MSIRFLSLLLLSFAATACSNGTTGDPPLHADPIAWASEWVDSLEEAAALDGEGSPSLESDSALARAIRPAIAPAAADGDRHPRLLAAEGRLLRLALLDGFLRRELFLANRYASAGKDRAQVVVDYHRWRTQEEVERTRSEGAEESDADLDRAFLLGLVQTEYGWRIESALRTGHCQEWLEKIAAGWQAEAEPRRMVEEIVEVRLRRRRPDGSVYLECQGKTAGHGDFPASMEQALERGAELRVLRNPAVTLGEFEPWWDRFRAMEGLPASGPVTVDVALQRQEDGAIWSAGNQILVKNPANPPEEFAEIAFSELHEPGWGPGRVLWFGSEGIPGADLAPVVEAWFRVGARIFDRAELPEPVPFDPVADPVAQVAWLVDVADRVLLENSFETETFFLFASDDWNALANPYWSWPRHSMPASCRSFQEAIDPLISASLARELEPVDFASQASPQPADSVFPASILLKEFRYAGSIAVGGRGWLRSLDSHSIGFPPDPDRRGVRLRLDPTFPEGGDRAGKFCFHFRREQEGWRIDQMPNFGFCEPVYQLEQDREDGRLWRVRRDDAGPAPAVHQGLSLEIVEAGRLVPDMAGYSRGRLKKREGRKLRFADGPAFEADADAWKEYLGDGAATTRFQLSLPADATYEDVITAIDVLLSAGVLHLDLLLPPD